jgi:putative PIN family toxin of toxin-antitoxin system
VIIDTNVVASAMAFPKSIPRRAFDKAIEDGQILVSLPVLAEWHEVLGRQKWDKYIPRSKRMRFLLELLRVADWVEVTDTIAACRDPKDDRFLELAISGRADVIVSGDQDLLVLHPFRNVPILTPAAFLNETTP